MLKILYCSSSHCSYPYTRRHFVILLPSFSLHQTPFCHPPPFILSPLDTILSFSFLFSFQSDTILSSSSLHFLSTRHHFVILLSLFSLHQTPFCHPPLFILSPPDTILSSSSLYSLSTRHHFVILLSFLFSIRHHFVILIPSFSLHQTPFCHPPLFILSSPDKILTFSFLYSLSIRHHFVILLPLFSLNQTSF